MRYISLILNFTLCVTILRAAPALSADTGVESLGDNLLEDLTPNAPEPSAQQPTENDDQSAPAPDNPQSIALARVRKGMQQAEGFLGAKSTSADASGLKQAGESQQQVVAQLDQLIAELSKQCKNGQCNKPGAKPAKPSQRSQNKPGKPKSAAGHGQTAARDSTDRLDQTTAKPADKGDIEAMAKDLWGHLPERTREQMMQSFSEEFLPEYELEIEQYYRRLSEDDNNLRAD